MNIELEAIYFLNFSPPLFCLPSLPSSLLTPLLSHSSLMRLLDNDPCTLFLIRHTQWGRPCLNPSLSFSCYFLILPLPPFLVPAAPFSLFARFSFSTTNGLLGIPAQYRLTMPPLSCLYPLYDFGSIST